MTQYIIKCLWGRISCQPGKTRSGRAHSAISPLLIKCRDEPLQEVLTSLSRINLFFCWSPQIGYLKELQNTMLDSWYEAFMLMLSVVSSYDQTWSGLFKGHFPEGFVQIQLCKLNQHCHVSREKILSHFKQFIGFLSFSNCALINFNI